MKSSKILKLMANKKILEEYTNMKFITRNQKKDWRTYLPDETKPNKRRPVKRKSKENLEKEIHQILYSKRQKD